MSSYVWELPGPSAQCGLYLPGHQVHWIQFNQSMRKPGVVTPVTAVVDDDGLVHISGDDLSLVQWNHRPDLLRTALQRFGGRAAWKSLWCILAVPTDIFMGGARTVFYLTEPDARSECRSTRRANPDGPRKRHSNPVDRGGDEPCG